MYFENEMFIKDNKFYKQQAATLQATSYTTHYTTHYTTLQLHYKQQAATLLQATFLISPPKKINNDTWNVILVYLVISTN